MLYMTERPTPDQQARAQQSPLYARGDIQLVWVNESDLCPPLPKIDGRASSVQFLRDHAAKLRARYVYEQAHYLPGDRGYLLTKAAALSWAADAIEDQELPRDPL